MPPIDPKGLAEAMRLKGMTTAALAAAVGVPEPVISQLRSGARNAARRPELRRRIADVLDVPIRWIEEGDD